MGSTFLLFAEVIIYFIAIMVLGVFTRKWVSNMSDFFTSGRELSAITMALGLAGIMFSGATLPTISGFTISHSLWIGSFYMWGWALGIFIFGRFFAPAIRRSGVMTLPEWAEIRFDSKTRTVVAIATSIAAFGALFAQVVGLGNNMATITGWPYWLCALIVVVICTIYMFAGGFWALSVSDMCHMTITAISFVVVLLYLGAAVGSPTAVAAAIPDSEKIVGSFLGKSPDWFMTSFKYPSFMSLLCGWFLCQMGCQYYWMRAIGGRSEKAVKRGYYLSGLITIIFGSTMLAFFGVYAIYMYGDKATSANAFGLIVKGLPVGLDGLLFTGMVAGCMSTFSTALLGVSAPITRDIYQRLINPKADAETMTRASRIITVAVAVVGYGFAYFWKAGSGHGLAFMWAFSCPTAALLLLSYCWKKVTVPAGFIGELVGLVFTAYWYISGKSSIVHPMWVGFVSTFVLVLVISFFTQPKYYGKDGYKSPDASKNPKLQQNSAAFMAYQEEQYAEAMRNLMRPAIGTASYKAAVEKHHDKSFSIADFVFPHLTGRRPGDAVIVERTE